MLYSMFNMYLQYITLQLMEWFQKKTGKYTSHDWQNEMFKIMALPLLRKTAINLRTTEF